MRKILPVEAVFTLQRSHTGTWRTGRRLQASTANTRPWLALPSPFKASKRGNGGRRAVLLGFSSSGMPRASVPTEWHGSRTAAAASAGHRQRRHVPYRGHARLATQAVPPEERVNVHIVVTVRITARRKKKWAWATQDSWHAFYTFKQQILLGSVQK